MLSVLPQGERCSFPVQMLNYQLRGLLHKLEHLAPRRVAAKIACVVLSETLTFMADRYMRVKPSFARTNQLRWVACVIVSRAVMLLCVRACVHASGQLYNGVIL